MESDIHEKRMSAPVSGPGLCKKCFGARVPLFCAPRKHAGAETANDCLHGVALCACAVHGDWRLTLRIRLSHAAAPPRLCRRSHLWRTFNHDNFIRVGLWFRFPLGTHLLTCDLKLIEKKNNFYDICFNIYLNDVWSIRTRFRTNSSKTI